MEGFEEINHYSYQLLFHTVGDKNKAIEIWKQASQNEDQIFKMETQDTTITNQTVQLQGIPMEYPDIAVIEYLKKYFEDPTLSHDTYPGTNYKNGIRSVHYTSLK